tara:strand:- start:26 stop:1033 length:1008 start_codon:yes stop_codon:yes gene_type:complete
LIVSFLICPNGNGHLFRTIDLISSFLKKKKIFKINIFCSKAHSIKLINCNLSLKKIKIFPIVPNYDLRKNTYKYLIDLYNLKINQKIINLTDVFISDNLINRFLPTEKLLIHSNFFWSDVFTSKKFLTEYKNLENFFLSQKGHILISNRYFGTNKKNIKIKKIEIGFTGSNNIKKNKILTKYKNKKVLVYFSGSDLIPYYLINKLIKRGYKLYSDNINLLRDNRILKFDRQKIDMESFSYLITKPGLGSIKDSIKFKILPIFYFNKSNFEYVENYKKLEFLKIFFKDNHFNEQKIFKSINSINYLIYKKTINKFSKFKFDGDRIFLKLLKNYEKR